MKRIFQGLIHFLCASVFSGMSALDGSALWDRMLTTRRARTEPVSCAHLLPKTPLLAYGATVWPYDVNLYSNEGSASDAILCLCCWRRHAGGGDQDVHGQAAGRAVPAGGWRGAGLADCGRYPLPVSRPPPRCIAPLTHCCFKPACSLLHLFSN